MSQHHYGRNVKGSSLSIYLRRQKIRQELIKENGRKCGYCFKKPKKLTLDHIQPLSKGGADTKDNMMLCCESCNNIKSNMDIDEWMKHLGWEL
jgi:5-methylcytosine-specific restriction endonuclease McrA